MLRIDPPLPMRCPKGRGLAHFVIDYGLEHDLKWVIFLDDSGECWTYSNEEVRAQKNITMGREHISPFYDPDSVSLKAKDCSECMRGKITHYTLNGKGLCQMCVDFLMNTDPPEDFTNV